MNLTEAREMWGSMMNDQELNEWLELRNKIRPETHDPTIPMGATIEIDPVTGHTRRSPGKLPPTDLRIKPGKTWYYVGRPFNSVEFIQNVRDVNADENGNIWWNFKTRTYKYERP